MNSGPSLRLFIPLTGFEATKLEERAMSECRDVRSQARYLLLQALGLSPTGIIIDQPPASTQPDQPAPPPAWPALPAAAGTRKDN